MLREAWSFFVHLRWHYQVFILSGGYLLGGLFQPLEAPGAFVLQFLNVHLLLNGGVTAFNSYYDEDEGPIGGLERPPPMTRWMMPASLVLQMVGAALAAREGTAFAVLWGLTMVLSVFYSAPPFRWKSRPLLSLVAVGVGTGTNTFLMGYLAAGPAGLDARAVIAAAGVALLLLSLYPVSQVFQIEEDRARGDHGFAVVYGLAGVKRFFATTYPVGLVVASAALATARPTLGIGLFAAGVLGGTITARTVLRLRAAPGEYRAVMRLKYGASLGFVAFVAAALVWAPAH